MEAWIGKLDSVEVTKHIKAQHANVAVLMGSLSSCVEIASRWHKPQKHFSPVDFYVSQAIGYPL